MDNVENLGENSSGKRKGVKSMNYQEFKKEVEEKFMSYMPGEYKSMTLVTVKSMKTNEEMDGIYIKEIEEQKGRVPTLYINSMYRNYLNEDKNFEKEMKKAAEFMVELIENIPEFKKPTFGAEAHENIIFYLVNAKQNEKMLEQMPHRRFLDLAIVYKLRVDENATTIIHNRIAKLLDLSEEELYEIALKNTQEKMQSCVFMIGPNLLVMTNKDSFLGAATMLYEGALQEVAENINSDLYVLPSSIHEIILYPADGSMTPEELAEMVRTINEENVDMQERLSNQVYKYSREKGQLEFATKVNEEEKPWK